MANAKTHKRTNANTYVTVVFMLMFTLTFICIVGGFAIGNYMLVAFALVPAFIGYILKTTYLN